MNIYTSTMVSYVHVRLSICGDVCLILPYNSWFNSNLHPTTHM